MRLPESPAPAETQDAGLLVLTAYVVVPVDEGALRVVTPGPDVEFEERIEAETVGRGDQLKRLAIELRRNVVVVLEPGLGVDDIFDADQAELAAAGRLVDQRFGRFLIDFAVADERAFDVVNAHGAVVRTGNAAKGRPVTCRAGIVDVEENTSGVSDVFD